MWIVQLALRQPHTFIVMAILIAIFGVVSITGMPVDIFPVIDVPVVSCVWTYTGMSPANIENLITTPTERAFTSTVGGIERMESMSLNGLSIIKVYLHKGADVGQAIAQVSSTANAVMKQLPNGITPPFVTQSSATDVPVLELVVKSQVLGEAELFDTANNFIRVQLAVVQGATIPYPNGGKYRQVNVDLNPEAMRGYGISAQDVTSAVNSQSVIAPAGTAKMGNCEYIIALNNMPDVIDKINHAPIKHVNGAVVYIKDVAFVHDGFQPQLNIVNVDGHRSVIMSILKNGAASTLTVVNQIKSLLPMVRKIVPPSVSVDILTDQSIFVQECINEVVQEAVTAAFLTGILMLAILGSWRSTLIVVTSIPLAILTSIIGLHITGNTINSMTLGGLALAVGMLVDDATVEVENVHRQMDMGKHIERAILDGAQEVALPAFVSTISICIVFLPVFLLSEPARSLFIPLGLAVSFAMLASYGLSRTIVPLMSKHLFVAEEHVAGQVVVEKEPGFFGGIHLFIDRNFNLIRDIYHRGLEFTLSQRKATVLLFLAFYAVSFCILPFIGMDFFPPIDAGQLRLHLNVPGGTRVEVTERIFRAVENSIGQIIPKSDIEVMTDNIGIPVSGVNYAFSDCQTIGEADGEILISLKEHRQHSTWWYQKQIRAMLTHDYPQCSYYFQPADIITQILNAGLPAPIDLRIAGMNKSANFQIAQDVKRLVDTVPGAVDVCVHQVVNDPQYLFRVDRTRADELGLSQKDVSNSLLVNVSSSFQTAPNFWVSPQNGVQYYLQTLSPQYRLSSLNDLNNINLSSAQTQDNPSNFNPQTAVPTPLLGNVAIPERQYTPYVVNHVNVQPVYDVYAACQGRDLGGVSTDVQKIVDEYAPEREPGQKELPQGSFINALGATISDGFAGLPKGDFSNFDLDLKQLTHQYILEHKPGNKLLPRGTRIVIAGQVLSMQTAFAGLLIGLVGALIMVYLLLVVNFQSWTDPIIILMAVPGALSGIIWSLYVTQTTFSVPALMGTIMTIGVASANSILMVTFCNEQMHDGKNSIESASAAGFQRFRPVCMTAMAMVIGMIPMSLSSGQNAPIGRAVIGGLSVATFSTLFFVPIIYSIFKQNFKPAPQVVSEHEHE